MDGDAPISETESESERTALDAAASGDHGPVGVLMQDLAPRLARIVAVRLDTRLRSRVDPEDVVQDVFARVTSRLPDYLKQRSTGAPGRLPFFLWLRVLTREAVIQFHRHHLGTDKRDAGREQHAAPAQYGATSVQLAHLLTGDLTTPTGALARSERRESVAAALEEMSEGDREILLMRHFESLTNKEIARLLGISEGGASLRHLRALQNLKRCTSLTDRDIEESVG